MSDNDQHARRVAHRSSARTPSADRADIACARMRSPCALLRRRRNNRRRGRELSVYASRAVAGEGAATRCLPRACARPQRARREGCKLHAQASRGLRERLGLVLGGRTPRRSRSYS